ncbi:MAG TPA: zinc-dependent metalloprotease [Pirellulales bacterium]|nr:zinc-dependent metalloprotease [Pirellulales bacterium]
MLRQSWINQFAVLRGSIVALALAASLGWTLAASAAGGEEAASSASSAKSAAARAEQKFPEWSKVTEGCKLLEGLFNLYYNESEQKLLMVIRQDQYNQEFILPISIARGAGMMYLGGNTLNFGDQWLISFRRAADRVLVIRRNIRFKADEGSPQAEALKVSYNDSVIMALPIKSEEGHGSRVLVDLADLFMTDLGRMGIMPDRTRSTWGKIKVFQENVEIELNAVFGMGLWSYFGIFDSFFGGDSIADSRGVQIVMHYGLSKLPGSGYHPRVADDRVGHFLSTVKDFSNDISDTPQIRYVTRWNLEKSNASADKSPPKKPILFWIEKTVPREYRPYVRAGILEWNKAFDKLGFIEAIEVREQSDLDDFDPEDIRYNTFRWITTSYGFAMGPSRTNPKTGQILDADIIFDEGMIRYWRSEYLRTRGLPEAMGLAHQGQRQAFYKLYASQIPEYAANRDVFNHAYNEYQEALQAQHTQHPEEAAGLPPNLAWMQPRSGCECCMMGPGVQRQLGLMAAVMSAQGSVEPGGKVPQEFIGQAIKEVVMHEVGHTLGLRHNFKASSVSNLKDLNNTEITRKNGLVASVMDYSPANFALQGQKQGDYFSDTIGPYDYWAIEYAYKPVSGSEAEELGKIAAKSSAPELTFGTDGDTWRNPDPRVNLFDLGDPLEFSQHRIALVKQSLDKLQDRVVGKGEGWQRARQTFAMLLGELAQAAFLSSQYIGGEYTSRAHREDPDGKLPFEPIPVAKQREAMKVLKDEILSDQAFQFSPELLKRLAPQHWDEGMSFWAGSYEFSLNDRVLAIQEMVLSRLLDPQVLKTIQNAETHATEGQEVLRLPEIFDTLTDAVWKELPPAGEPEGEKKKIGFSNQRRNLQRAYLGRLSTIVLGPKNDPFGFLGFIFSNVSQPSPSDARALARMHLKQIDDRIVLALNKDKVELDSYSRAHLEQVHDQIGKVLSAPLEMNEP